MHYDLIIVGGGLVGASLAVALGDSPLQIALIDARAPSSADPRLIALNSSSCQLLKNINVWASLNEYAAPIHHVHVSNQKQFGSIRLSAADLQLAGLGHVIPAHRIEAALNEILENATNVTVYHLTKLTDLIQTVKEVTLTLATEAGEITLTAPIVIGADGTDSTVRSLLPISTDVIHYEQSAIVTRTILQRSHQHIAYERFTRDGAIAMLPLVGNECATIWTADAAQISKLMALAEADFLNTLQKEFGYRLGRLQGIERRYTYPLRRVIAEKNYLGSVFLLGNAAHTLHPIAAQGFNLALYEVAILAEGFLKNMVDLAKLNAAIQAHQAMNIGMSHQLTRLFRYQSTLVNGLLQIGMVGFNLSSLAKRKFVSRMLGRSGHVPRLLLSVNE